MLSVFIWETINRILLGLVDHCQLYIVSCYFQMELKSYENEIQKYTSVIRLLCIKFKFAAFNRYITAEMPNTQNINVFTFVYKIKPFVS